MQKTIVFILSLLATTGFSQTTSFKEKKIETTVKKATVFMEGAQVVREKTIKLDKGKTLLNFSGLSPFIDDQSIQVKSPDNLTVLSVNHRHNYLNKPEKSQEIKALENQIEKTKEKLTLEQARLQIKKDEITFLHENRDIGGKDQATDVTSLKETSEFYGKKLTRLKMKEIDFQKNIKQLKQKKKNLEKQLKSLTGKEELPVGEILVKVKTKAATEARFEISYLVGNAGWNPAYDIRAEDINQPIKLVYKARVYQDTKVDWNDVDMSFSSSDPTVSGSAPELRTYYLDYNTPPPNYSKSIDEVSGLVTDKNNDPLPFVSVKVNGTSIGTTTNIDGRYSLSIPSYARQLKFSFVGYESKIVPINRTSINVTLKASNQQLEHVVETEMAGRTQGTRPSKARRKSFSGKKAFAAKKNTPDKASVIEQPVERQTSVNFNIKKPYTLKSDPKKTTVQMKTYQLPAEYQYYCVPKIDEDAFLTAHITDWEKYNLLSGETSIFFEDTYVGKSVLDTRYASDTLQISLGRDKGISVEREKTKQFTSRQFIGNKKEVVRNWQITIKNNKSQKVDLVLQDQLPVSNREEIEVEIQDISNASLTEKTGKLEWTFSLAPGKEKSLDLKYAVKYPKKRTLNIK